MAAVQRGSDCALSSAAIGSGAEARGGVPAPTALRATTTRATSPGPAAPPRPSFQVVPGTRKVPAQARSRARLVRVLEATAELVEEFEPEHVTTAMMAQRAEVSVPWLYDFFDDRQAVFDALLFDGLGRLDLAIIEATAETLPHGWRKVVEAVVDTVVAHYRRQPGYRALWFSPFVSENVLEASRANSEALADRLARFLFEAGLAPPDRHFNAVAMIGFGIVDSGLELAFRRNHRGDRRLIAETKVAAIAYLERYLN